MSAFGGLVLTNRGRTLQAKAQAGATLHYTRIALGDGYLGSSAIPDLTGLKNQVISLPITKLRVLSAGRAIIGSYLSNKDLNSGFYYRELGIFAQDPDVGEILYCYGNAGNLAEYIPAGGGADVLEKSIDLEVLTGNAANVSAVIDSSLVYVTMPELEATRTELKKYTDDAIAAIDLSPLATKEALAAHSADYVLHTYYGIATGVNAKTILLDPAPTQYIEGMAIVFKNKSTNNGPVTINVNSLGAKKLLKSNGTELMTNFLRPNSIYTARFNGESFILDGSGSGELKKKFVEWEDRSTIVPKGTTYIKKMNIPKDAIEYKLYLEGSIDGFGNQTQTIAFIWNDELLAQNNNAPFVFSISGNVTAPKIQKTAYSTFVFNNTTPYPSTHGNPLLYFYGAGTNLATYIQYVNYNKSTGELEFHIRNGSDYDARLVLRFVVEALVWQ